MEDLQGKVLGPVGLLAVMSLTALSMGALSWPELSLHPITTAASGTTASGTVDSRNMGSGATYPGQHKSGTYVVGHHSSSPHAKSITVDEKVLIIGSSVAQGWHDNPAAGGYLRRAFGAYSQVSPNQCTVINKAIPGAGVMNIVHSYPKWLREVHPNIVVIAWGGLNDLHDGTPMKTIQSQVDWEIKLALQQKAMVFLVTSPVSKASYTTYKGTQKQLFDVEMNTAESLHNPNVYVFDVYTETYDYFASNNIPYGPFMADGWHPNAAGHELTAQLLLKDFVQEFGTKPLMFQPVDHGNA